MLYQWLISLPMMLCFFWSIYFVVQWCEDRTEPRVKAAILLFFIAATVLYTDHWFYFSEQQSAIGAWTYLIANLSVYPLYYVYLRALTRSPRNTETFLLFIPAGLIAIFFPLNRYWGWISEAQQLYLVRLCFAIEVVYVWWRGYQILRDTRARLDDTYSDYRSHLLHPTYINQHLLGITAAISILLNLLGRDFFTESVLVTIPATIMSTLLFGIGYVASRTVLPQETVESDMPPADLPQDNTALTHSLDAIMREQQLYTDPDLTIFDVAAALGSNRTYLSTAINQSHNLSFSQYIAKLRVEHAKTILTSTTYSSDHDALNAAIALSGFSTEQTFYRVFKDFTGSTPLQYRHQHRS